MVSGCLTHGGPTSEFITRCTYSLVNKLYQIGKFTDSQRAGVEFRLSKLGGRGTKSERELQVNAVVAAEKSMVTEDRIARLESDVGELKGDVKALNARVSESIIANAKEFGGLKTEMEKGFGTLRTEIEKNRADTEKGCFVAFLSTSSG